MPEVVDNAAKLRHGPRPDALVAFRNRLMKGARHWSRWARRGDIGAYRIYDRDLPEFPLAIDCYVAIDPAIGMRLHVQEIETGWQQDEREHSSWQKTVREAIGAATDLPPSSIVMKERPKHRARGQRGQRATTSPVSGTKSLPGKEFAIAEAGLRFLVNLEAHLDTGLFLDHRSLRSLVRATSANRRMLNLFAYTASFSVYAAAGGASGSDSVDLSNTYVDWAARNFALNGIDARRHALIRADVFRWLEEAGRAGRRYDLIVLDPPAFSNSKMMDRVLDIQRDHAGLIMSVRRLLAPSGELFFSTNLRTFELDPALVADPKCVDITARTLPPDFRDRQIHHAFHILA